jgi:hypothetical protein
LPEIVQLMTVRAPLLPMPPPFWEALLPETVLLIMVAWPLNSQNPPL